MLSLAHNKGSSVRWLFWQIVIATILCAIALAIVGHDSAGLAVATIVSVVVLLPSEIFRQFGLPELWPRGITKRLTRFPLSNTSATEFDASVDDYVRTLSHMAHLYPYLKITRDATRLATEIANAIERETRLIHHGSETLPDRTKLLYKVVELESAHHDLYQSHARALLRLHQASYQLRSLGLSAELRYDKKEASIFLFGTTRVATTDEVTEDAVELLRPVVSGHRLAGVK